MLQLILLIICFILLSGTWAMIDAAILSITPAEVEELIQKKKWGSKQLKSLLQHLTRAIIVIVILTNITNVLGPILIGQQAIAVFQSNVIGVITAILTFATIIFSEIIPKAVGAHYSPTISRTVAPLLRSLSVILFPLIWILERVVHLFKSGKRNIGTEAQIRALVDIGGGAGHIDQTEKELIHRTFILNDRKAKDIMKPREKIIALPIAATIRQAAKPVFQYSYSRFPVYGATLDDIRGLVLSHDILQDMADGNEYLSLQSLMRDILFITPHMSADDLLHHFRKRQIHMAIVRDSGKTVGIVTLEDVLEELVGEIEDERDE